MHGAKPLDPLAQQHYVDPSYFQRAIEMLTRKVEKPHFFVFSDYPDWARQHVRSPHPIEFVTDNGAEKDYEVEATSSPSGVTHVTFTRAGV